MTKVLAFGVFDGLHEGHKFFVKEAKKLGDHLTVVITPDEAVKSLKNKIPGLGLKDRTEHLKKIDQVDEVVLGDSQIGRWAVFENFTPDIIAIGYDQDALEVAVKKYFEKKEIKPKFVRINGFRTDTYKTSLIQKQNG
ncbi:MAG: FAD synthetase [Parcubacteria group bacterium Gr01-1014_20]|nr:MAG: FAD synthetase [Parcubacteria group bacterium Gr01-1014_20]